MKSSSRGGERPGPAAAGPGTWDTRGNTLALKIVKES
jgi:hypothetical protein